MATPNVGDRVRVGGSGVHAGREGVVARLTPARVYVEVDGKHRLFAPTTLRVLPALAEGDVVVLLGTPAALAASEARLLTGK